MAVLAFLADCLILAFAVAVPTLALFAIIAGTIELVMKWQKHRAAATSHCYLTGDPSDDTGEWP